MKLVVKQPRCAGLMRGTLEERVTGSFSSDNSSSYSSGNPCSFHRSFLKPSLSFPLPLSFAVCSFTFFSFSSSIFSPPSHGYFTRILSTFSTKPLKQALREQLQLERQPEGFVDRDVSLLGEGGEHKPSLNSHWWCSYRHMTCLSSLSHPLSAQDANSINISLELHTSRYFQIWLSFAQTLSVCLLPL